MASELVELQESLAVNQADRAPRDSWEWLVEYRDGTFTYEYDDDGQARGWGSIDKSRVAMVTLIPRREGLGYHALKVDSTSGKTPDFFRRRSREVTPSGEDLGEIGVIHALGWRDASGEPASYTFIMPNGNVLVSDDLNAV